MSSELRSHLNLFTLKNDVVSTLMLLCHIWSYMEYSPGVYSLKFLTVPQIAELTTSYRKICFYFLKIVVEAEVLNIILFFPTYSNILRPHQQYNVLDHFSYLQVDKEESRNVQWFSWGCNKSSLFLTASNNIHCFYFC